MKSKYFIIDIFILGVVSLILNSFNIRVCIFYHLFKIPCPGCGLTRGFIELSHFHILKSLRYNILCIPILCFVILYSILFILKKEYLLSDFLNEHKAIIIALCSLLMIIVFIININNPLLY